jgi:hypothetical protein
MALVLHVSLSAYSSVSTHVYLPLCNYMDVFLCVINASLADASIPAYDTGFTRVSHCISVSVGRPTYHSVTIWTTLFVPFMLVV